MDEDLPLRICGISHCYRTEAGAAGRASRGSYRVHNSPRSKCLRTHCQIKATGCTRVGTVDVIRSIRWKYPSGSSTPRPVTWVARRIESTTSKPGYQVAETGESGRSHQYVKLHGLPGQATEYSLQKERGKGTHFVHTLNGTAFGISRALIAILENHQQANGTRMPPPALHPYMGCEAIVSG